MCFIVSLDQMPPENKCPECHGVMEPRVIPKLFESEKKQEVMNSETGKKELKPVYKNHPVKVWFHKE